MNLGQETNLRLSLFLTYKIRLGHFGLRPYIIIYVLNLCTLVPVEFLVFLYLLHCTSRALLLDMSGPAGRPTWYLVPGTWLPGASGQPSPRLNCYLSLGEGLPEAPGVGGLIHRSHWYLLSRGPLGYVCRALKGSNIRSRLLVYDNLFICLLDSSFSARQKMSTWYRYYILGV